MARITKPTEKNETPADLEEVSKYIAEIGSLQRQIEESKIKLNEETAKLKQKALDSNLLLERRINELTDAIERFTQIKWAELFTKKNRKSIKLVSGFFGKRLCGPWVNVYDEELALADIKERKREELIKITESVRKDMIKGNPELAEGIRGIEVKPKEDVFFISPFDIETVEGECG